MGGDLSLPAPQIDTALVLGEGASARVYAGVLGGRDVAVKVARARLEGRERERFLAEAGRLAKVKHPHVVEVLGAGVLPDGRPYLTMPRVAGRPLAARVAEGPLAVGDALAIFDKVASGVSALHDEGLLHRDLKPENVLLAETAELCPIVLDLGIARDVTAGPSTETLEGVVRGTPATMAPERFFGTPATHASDVYELALLLYAMLAGALPWPAEADVEARLHPRPLAEVRSDVPVALSDEIAVALSTRPERRPESALVLRERIAAAMHGESDARRRTASEPRRAQSLPAPGAPRGRRVPRAAYAAAVAVLCAVGAAGGGTLASRSTSVRGTVAARDLAVAARLGGAAAVAPAEPEPEPDRPRLATPSSAPAPSTRAPAAPSSSAPQPPAAEALAWCRKLVDVQCDPEYQKAPGGPAMCAHGRSNLALFATAAPEVQARFDATCKGSYDAQKRDIAVVVAAGRRAAALAALPPPKPPFTGPWCRSIRNAYCRPQVTWSPRGQAACDEAQRTVAALDAAPLERAPALDEACHGRLAAAISDAQAIMAAKRAAP